MRIHCDACENNVASVMCCADEAALCSQCDAQIHAANSLASRHQRVQLLPPAKILPKCDVCQDKTAFFFCIEERALFCRNCDESVHTCNALTAKHRRLLVTGTRVALSPEICKFSPEPQINSAAKQSMAPRAQKGQSRPGNLEERHPANIYQSMAGPSRSTPEQHSQPSAFVSSFYQEVPAGCLDSQLYNCDSVAGPSSASDSLERSPFVERRNDAADALRALDEFSEIGSDLEWGLSDFLNIPELAYSFADIESSKATVSANLGGYDWLADASLLAEHSYTAAMVQHLPPHSGTSGASSSLLDQSPEASDAPRSVPKVSRPRVEAPVFPPQMTEAFAVPDFAGPVKKRKAS